MSLTNPRRNEIYLVEFPYSGFEQSKKRPAVIISKNNYNEKEPDVIVCGITSNLDHPWVTIIEDSDLEFGNLFEKSGARVDMISRIDKNTLKFKVGKITDEFHQKLLHRINELIG